jgi:hypothetical protein
MSTTRPYIQRAKPHGLPEGEVPSGCGTHVDLLRAHMPPYGDGADTAAATRLFGVRAAAAISAAVALDGAWPDNGPPAIWPPVQWRSVPLYGDGTVTYTKQPTGNAYFPRDLLELKTYFLLAPTIHLPTAKCLNALAYGDHFPRRARLGEGLRIMVSGAMLASSPGWCGTWGPGVDGAVDLALGDPTEGNYDLTQMHLLPAAYLYYDELSPDARERLITLLLARGRIHRPNKDDTFTSGVAPNDWGRAGYVSPLGAHKDIGETENHILMIASTRYLTNQLLYQRDHKGEHDNRRNGGDDWPSSVELLTDLLRRMLRDDFSEYNAKSYQSETRWALLNLASYAYDSEVRLGARLALDYLSARIATSSNDLRRLVPFRRRNEGANSAHDPDGVMTVGLRDGDPGADPMGSYFAMQAGNLRAFETNPPWRWGVKGDGRDLAVETLSSYRLPPSIHDLFVTDRHRRFFQRLHRSSRDEVAGGRNADNSEVFASSPSYLISAGGSPADYAIDPRVAGFVVAAGKNAQQLGVAVPTSFMPTGFGVGASELIQFGWFSEAGFVFNYGVAPDFACGYSLHLPGWMSDRAEEVGGFLFVDHSPPDRATTPGFYLAIRREGSFAIMEAFDTWLRSDVPYATFKADVLKRRRTVNAQVQLADDVEFTYTTWNGGRVTAKIWDHVEPLGPFKVRTVGAAVTHVEYGNVDRFDAIGDAGNNMEAFLAGTIMSSPAEAVVEVRNPALNSTITLDFSDRWHPRRVEDGLEEIGGPEHDMWVDFDWIGPFEGDAYRPFADLTAAFSAVEEPGTIRLLPGASADRPRLQGGKNVRLIAPLGGVTLGAIGSLSSPDPVGPSDPVQATDVWVQFDFPDSAEGNISGPSNTLSKALDAVPEGGVIRILPGVTSDRPTMGNGSYRVTAPIAGVVLGAIPRETPPPTYVWANFDWPTHGSGTPCDPFRALKDATDAIAPTGTVLVAPSVSWDRSSIGGRANFRLVAEGSGVVLGGR